MTAYYNECDPIAAAWLRELVERGHIAPGIVDERSIEDVRPDELAGYTQCHFFAGIGVWSYALRLAGVSDSARIWTGSCPCQPFSAAGKGGGFADERHLWPAWQWLIQQCRPPEILGEQVASKATGPWIDLVQADLEAMGYAFGCVPFPSAGVGAPHIRDRAFWLANSNDSRSQGWSGMQKRADQLAAGPGGMAGRMENPNSERFNGEQIRLQPRGSQQDCTEAAGRGGDSRMADAAKQRLIGRRSSEASHGRDAPRFKPERLCDAGERSGPTNGHWSDADWLLCRDGKWRPVEPGTFPLVNGAAARVGRLRGYGNAINAQAAAEFIKAAVGA